MSVAEVVEWDVLDGDIPSASCADCAATTQCESSTTAADRVDWEGLSPPYSTVVVDAPWRYPSVIDRQNKAVPRYSTLLPSEIAAFPVPDLLAPDAHVWLWVTNRVLAEGWHVQVLEAWQLRAQGALITWCKTGQPGVGAVARANTEHLLLAVRGRPPLPVAPLPSTWVTAGRVLTGRYGHSRKPPAFLDLVEQSSPGPYAELFQRQGRLGWHGWGWGYEGQVAALPARPHPC